VALEFRVDDNSAEVDMFRFLDGYSSSAHPDIATVVEHVRSQTDAEEDELLALKTDLPYFLSQIQFTKKTHEVGAESCGAQQLQL
jgi:hypothetical protein